MMAMRRMSMLAHEGTTKLSPRAQELAANINKYIDDAEKVRIVSVLRLPSYLTINFYFYFCNIIGNRRRYQVGYAPWRRL